MDFGTSISTCLTKKYVTFTGRASRSEMWFFTLFAFLLYFGISLFFSFVVMSSGLSPELMVIPSWIVSLALFLPNIAVNIRRLHDIDKSGWWLFLILVPLVGAIVLIFFLAKAGDNIDNKYGPVPVE